MMTEGKGDRQVSPRYSTVNVTVAEGPSSSMRRVAGFASIRMEFQILSKICLRYNVQIGNRQINIKAIE
jgi:hypothetical protein